MSIEDTIMGKIRDTARSYRGCGEAEEALMQLFTDMVPIVRCAIREDRDRLAKLERVRDAAAAAAMELEVLYRDEDPEDAEVLHILRGALAACPPREEG